MGTTLTGTTPQDTYDSLIKVTDNGPLSGTAKFLSDGLGNDSALALSTTAVGIGTDAPVSKANILATKTTALTTAADFLTLGLTIDDSTAFNNVGVGGGIVFRGKRNSGGVQTIYSAIDSSKEDAAADDFRGALRFYTNQNTTGVPLERMRITSAGNVGIAKTSPSNALHIAKAASSVLLDGLKVERDPSTTTSAIFNAFGGAANIVSNSGVTSSFTAPIVFALSDNTTTTEIARITSNGLTFNGDTAAANALDDYEEGTWTITITFDGSSTGMTYVTNTGTYTKIGRQVTVNGLVQLSNKGSSTGTARIAGLPFTIPNVSANYSTATLWFFNIDFANQFQSVADVNGTTISLFESTESGTITALNDTDFANNSEIIVSLTYFV